MSNFRTSAIILAGGSGTRMKSDKTKQFMDLFGATVLERAVMAFDKCDLIDEIIVVAKSDEAEAVSQIFNGANHIKAIKVVTGGKCRQESAKNGFEVVSKECDFVAIHDAARCLITSEMIAKVVEKAYKTAAATAACGVFDTVKTADSSGKIVSTIPRASVSVARRLKAS